MAGKFPSLSQSLSRSQDGGQSRLNTFAKQETRPQKAWLTFSRAFASTDIITSPEKNRARAVASAQAPIWPFHQSELKYLSILVFLLKYQEWLNRFIKTWMDEIKWDWMEWRFDVC